MRAGRRWNGVSSRCAAIALAGTVMLVGCGGGPDAPPEVPTSPSASVPAQPAVPAQPTSPAQPTAPAVITPSTPQPVGDPAAVVRISDGDTIVTTLGKVRLIGIDTPEQGECGYQEASRNAAVLVPVGSEVTLVRVPGRDDTDKYDRLLRYVRTADGVDFGLAQITAGYAVARYDSRDGFGAHPLQEQYITADRASPQYTCGG